MTNSLSDIYVCVWTVFDRINGSVDRSRRKLDVLETKLACSSIDFDFYLDLNCSLPEQYCTALLLQFNYFLLIFLMITVSFYAMVF